MMFLARYLTVFAWRDLTAPGARRSTRVMAQTVALVCALSVALFGFVFGLRRVMERRQQQDSLALCLTVGDYRVSRRLTPEVMAELAARVNAGVNKAGGVEGVFGFYQAEFRFRNARDNGIDLFGRTLLLERDGRRDPLLTRRLLDGGREFAGPDDEGIILTPAALAALGLPAGAPPRHLRMVPTDGKDVEVPVLGVTREDLPAPHQFLILPAYERRLFAGGADPRLSSVRTTPLPPGWPDAAALRDGPRYAGLRELLRSPAWDLRPPARQTRHDRAIWFLSRNDNPDRGDPPLSEWNERLRLMQETVSTPEERRAHPLKVDPRTVPVKVEPPPADLDLASIYVRDLPSLAEAADAVEAVRAGQSNLEADRRVVNEYIKIGQLTGQVLAVLLLIEAVVLLIGVSNLGVMQSLRAEQRIAETGMLKAMGMTWRGLMAVEAIEGLMLWLPASLLGLLVGLALQSVACRCWYRDAAEAALGFYWSWPLLLAVTLGAGVITLACGLRATARVRGAAPSDSLRGVV